MDEELPMKVLGGRNPRPYWERFDRLQNRAQMLLGTAVSPKGVFRFHSFEEFNEWKMNHRLKKSAASRSRTT